MDYYTRLIFVVLTSLHEPELENTCKNTQLCIGAVDTVLSHGHFIHLACERCATTGHPSCTASSSVGKYVVHVNVTSEHTFCSFRASCTGTNISQDVVFALSIHSQGRDIARSYIFTVFKEIFSVSR